MDYEELLKKYMQHVLDCEGTTFVHRSNGGYGTYVEFSEDEVAELALIENELEQ